MESCYYHLHLPKMFPYTYHRSCPVCKRKYRIIGKIRGGSTDTPREKICEQCRNAARREKGEREIDYEWLNNLSGFREEYE